MNRAILLRTAAVLTIATAALPAQAQTAPDKNTSATTAQATSAKPVQPLYRRIRAFNQDVRSHWGEVNPFYRRIRAFWGDVDPFFNNIRTFWGSIDPVATAKVAGAPDFNQIGSFWEAEGARWDGISASWSAAGGLETDAATYRNIADQLGEMTRASNAMWGAAVQARTGKSFDEGFANPLFAQFGFDPADPASLARLTPQQQSEFFVTWYDGLMEFAGVDHADHWMKSINWTPKLTQVQGGGSDAVIGLVDFFIAGDADVKSKLIYSGGSTFSTGHGAGVLSLIAASHDGKGIMGIAPKAKIAAYNPFDASGSADWSGITKGVREVTNHGARVVNLSLGVPGEVLPSDWRHVFKSNDGAKDKALYVIAAGNEGITATRNIEFKDGLDSTFLVVGSVDPSGNISDFSNRPGTVCIVQDGQCKQDLRKKLGDQLKEGGQLMRRFIVAPGELILVSDDNGGVVRQSGTSLSAPLVTGAVALIHDRWPWLKDRPREVAEIILRSARDLGEPGVDPVYGVGLLDVEAAQSPLSFDALKIYQVVNNRITELRPASVQQSGVKSVWETQGAFFSMFEKIDSAERDFLVPLSSRLVGSTVNGQYFQDYLYQRMVAWMNQPMSGPGAPPLGPPRLGFAGRGLPAAATAPGGWSFSATGRAINPYAVQQGHRLRMASTFFAQAPDGRTGFAFGYGDATPALGNGGFNLQSDYDPYTGGANPLVGFASGGSHMAVTSGLSEKVQVSFGYTEKRDAAGLDLASLAPGSSSLALIGLDRYRAEAVNVRVDYQLRPGVTLTAGATHLDEPTALLGVRSLTPGDLGGGAETAGLTIGAEVELGSGFQLAATATGTRTASNRRAALRAGAGGLMGSAYQLAFGKTGIVGNGDRLRLSVAQPLALRSGTIDFDSVQVVDRETGEIGVVTQRIRMAGQPRRMVLEANYGLPLLGGTARWSAFGRGEVGALQDGTARLLVGSEASLSF